MTSTQRVGKAGGGEELSRTPVVHGGGVLGQKGHKLCMAEG